MASRTWPSCTAPACPHVYKNGALAAEGARLRYIGWSVFQLTNGKLGIVECHLVLAGKAENPTGGGRAEGKVQAFDPYECNDPVCEGRAVPGEEETQKESENPANMRNLESEIWPRRNHKKGQGRGLRCAGTYRSQKPVEAPSSDSGCAPTGRDGRRWGPPNVSGPLYGEHRQAISARVPSATRTGR
jgi:hypothetical protein